MKLRRTQHAVLALLCALAIPSCRELADDPGDVDVSTSRDPGGDSTGATSGAAGAGGDGGGTAGAGGDGGSASSAGSGGCVPSPAGETCNGLDDDCDDVVDEDLGSTSCGVGECQITVQSCVDGSPQECVPGEPAAEICNGVDDDCDGQVDEDLGTIECGVGACAASMPSCMDGMPQECVPWTPQPETCNGVDDDCDGEIDNGVVNACGECGPEPTEICNAIDDDCDGDIDEAIPGCGLTSKCANFSLGSSAGSGMIPLELPTGDSLVPIVEVRRFEEGDALNGAWDLDYAEKQFSYDSQLGQGSLVSGRVCLFGVGENVKATWATDWVLNGQTKTLSVAPPINPQGVLSATLDSMRAYWPGGDVDLSYSSGASLNPWALSVFGGNSASWVQGQLTVLSLPAGYKLDQQAFKVYSAGPSEPSDAADATTKLYFTDDPKLGMNRLTVSVRTYHTCGADRLDYDVDCGGSSCTVKAWGGSSCSYIEGTVTQLQWVDNE